MNDATRDPWPAFVEAVARRLVAGEREYQGRSFERPPSELLAEIREELEDVCGWGYVLWTRLRALEAQLAEAEARVHEALPAREPREDAGGAS